MSAPIVLEARNVTKSFGVTPVLRNLDFKLPLGSRYAIMGPSGSGKSTFLNCCSGIEHPDSGSLTITGTELSDSSPDELVELRKRSIGYVFQSFNLLQTLTAFENIELPVQLLGLSKSERCDRVNSLLEKVGLAHRAHSLPQNLSGGECQRTAIARALVHHPDLVLADEPTGSLDSQSSSQVLDLLESLSAEHNTSLLLVTHDKHATRICDRTFYMQDGCLST